MTSLHLARRLLLIATCAWCVLPAMVVAAMDSGPAQSLGASTQHLSLLHGSDAEDGDFTSVSGRHWLEQQWAALSPEQRDELRNQIREHRQRSRDERRNEGESSRNPGRGLDEGRQQRLSPDQREEFRQWMRERRGGERGDRGRGPP